MSQRKKKQRNSRQPAADTLQNSRNAASNETPYQSVASFSSAADFSEYYSLESSASRETLPSREKSVPTQPPPAVVNREIRPPPSATLSQLEDTVSTRSPTAGVKKNIRPPSTATPPPRDDTNHPQPPPAVVQREIRPPPSARLPLLEDTVPTRSPTTVVKEDIRPPSTATPSPRDDTVPPLPPAAVVEEKPRTMSSVARPTPTPEQYIPAALETSPKNIAQEEQPSPLPPTPMPTFKEHITPALETKRSSSSLEVESVSSVETIVEREYESIVDQNVGRVKKLTKRRPPLRAEGSSTDTIRDKDTRFGHAGKLKIFSTSDETSQDEPKHLTPVTSLHQVAEEVEGTRFGHEGTLKIFSTSDETSQDEPKHLAPVTSSHHVAEEVNEDSDAIFLKAKQELRRQSSLVQQNQSLTESLSESVENPQDETQKTVILFEEPLVAEYTPPSSVVSVSLESTEDNRFKREISRQLSQFSTNLHMGNAFIYMVIPPDKGYAWVIVLISFLCQVVVDGIIFSVGILLPYIGEDLGVSPTSIILVASVQIGCYFLIGPVVTGFINKFGFRPVAFSGAIASIITILIASYSPNMTMMLIFYSILGGPTLSMIWISSQLIIGYYFERYRPIANGLSCSGAGVGVVVFNFMNAQVVPVIGWRNTSRIHVGFLAAVLFMAIAYIEVEPTKVARVNNVSTKDDDSSSSTEQETVIDVMNSIRYSRYIRTSYQKKPDRGIDQIIVDYDKPEEDSWLKRKLSRYFPCLWPKKLPVEDPDHKRLLIKHDLIERQDLFYTGSVEYPTRPTLTRRTTTGQSLEVEPERRTSLEYTISVIQSSRPLQPQRSTLPELRRSHKHPILAYISPWNWLPKKMVCAFRLLFDFSLLRIMEFQILVLSAFFFPMGFNIPFVYSKMRAEIDSFNASLISPTIGFTNFIFRILSGFAANKFKEQTTYICGSGMCFGGVAVFISGFYGKDIVWFQYVYAASYGVAPAFYSTLRAIIYVRTLGLDKLTNAFGLTGLAMGFGVFLGTTTAAILNNLTGGYGAAFCFSGVCLFTAGFLKLILPTLVARKARNNTFTSLK